MKLKTLIDYTQRGAFNELYTPREAVDVIIPYLPPRSLVWECTSDTEKRGSIARRLMESGFDVVSSHIDDGKSFFEYEPDEYDVIVTNPPYQFKNEFLERAYELGKPFAFLLPLTTLEGIARGNMFGEHGVQVVVPNRRFNFKPEKNSGAWFQTSWFTHGLGIPNDLTFVNVPR